MPNKIEVIAKDILHVVEFPFTRTIQFAAVCDTAIKDSPVVKAAVIALVKAAELVISDVGLDVAAKGIDLNEDLKTLTDAKAFFAYFGGTFLPLIELVYKEIQADGKISA
jgi:hypothetical protein